MKVIKKQKKLSHHPKRFYFSSTENYSLKTDIKEDNSLKQDLKNERKWALIWGTVSKIETTGCVIMIAQNSPKPFVWLLNATLAYSLLKTIEHIYDAHQIKKYFGEYVR